jgi:hypothetical protein
MNQETAAINTRPAPTSNSGSTYSAVAPRHKRNPSLTSHLFWGRRREPSETGQAVHEQRHENMRSRCERLSPLCPPMRSGFLRRRRTADRKPGLSADQSGEVLITTTLEVQHLLDIGVIVRPGTSRNRNAESVNSIATQRVRGRHARSRQIRLSANFVDEEHNGSSRAGNGVLRNVPLDAANRRRHRENSSSGFGLSR